jgi:hypothetical protein
LPVVTLILQYSVGGFATKNACLEARCLTHWVEASVAKDTQIFWKSQELRQANENAEATFFASAFIADQAQL